MNIRSMTGYSQVKMHVDDQFTFTLSLKAVNHRFLDLHLRLPVEMDPVEMKIRRVLKERLHRGHIEVTLTRMPVCSASTRTSSSCVHVGRR